VTGITDERGYKTDFTYDAMNRLLTKVLPDGDSDGADGPTWTYGFDANGNPTTATDPNSHTTTTAFDSLNRRSSVSDALSEAADYSFDSAAISPKSPTR